MLVKITFYVPFVQDRLGSHIQRICWVLETNIVNLRGPAIEPVEVRA